MSTEAALIAGITRDCHDRLAVLVYADWLMEHRDLSRFGALRRAATVRVDVLRTYEVTSVKQMLSPGDPFHFVCCRLITRLLPELNLTGASFRVIRKYHRHRAAIGDLRGLSYVNTPLTVWVTARWMLRRLDAVGLVKDAEGKVHLADEYHDDIDWYEDAW